MDRNSRRRRGALSLTLRWARAGNAAVLGWTLLLLALPVAGRAAAAPAPHLRIAISRTPHASLLYLAAARGYFAAQGVAVDLVEVSHGKAALDLLGQGRVDLAAAAETPFVVAVLNGEPWSIAATVASTSHEMAVVARRDGGIAAPADLAGRRVGATRGTSGDYFLWALLVRHRVAPERVTVVDLPPGQLPSALAAHQVDAAATWEPVTYEARQALGSDAVTFTAPDAYTVTHVLIGRTDDLRARAQAIGRVLRATLQAERFVARQPDQALALVAKWLRLDASALRPSWQQLHLRVDLLQPQLLELEEEADWALERGYARAQPLPNFLRHLDLVPLDRERPDRVTVVH